MSPFPEFWWSQICTEHGHVVCRDSRLQLYHTRNCWGLKGLIYPSFSLGYRNSRCLESRWFQISRLGGDTYWGLFWRLRRSWGIWERFPFSEVWVRIVLCPWNTSPFLYELTHFLHQRCWSFEGFGWPVLKGCSWGMYSCLNWVSQGIWICSDLSHSLFMIVWPHQYVFRKNPQSDSCLLLTLQAPFTHLLVQALTTLEHSQVG